MHLRSIMEMVYYLGMSPPILRTLVKGPKCRTLMMPEDSAKV